MTRIETAAWTRMRTSKTRGGVIVIRSWFHTRLRRPRGQAQVQGLQAKAEAVLRDSADLFGWAADAEDRRHRPRPLPGGREPLSVRFHQTFKGLEVRAAEIVVNLHEDGAPYSIYNQYHYDIPDQLDPARITFGENQARSLVETWSGGFERFDVTVEPECAVYRYDREPGPGQRTQWSRPGRGRRRNAAERRRREILRGFYDAAAAELARTKGQGAQPRRGQHFLVWEVRVHTRGPYGVWLVRIDAMSGSVLQVSDELAYVRGDVFDPNPTVTSDDGTLVPGTAGIDPQIRMGVTLDRLHPPANGNAQELDGLYVKIADLEAPSVAPPTTTTGYFTSAWNEPTFLATMCYHHIDRLQHHIENAIGIGTGGLDLDPVDQIQVDPVALGGSNGAYYSSFKPAGSNTWVKSIRLGGSGSLIPNASDAHIIVHEFGHAHLARVLPGVAIQDGVDEGFCDFLAAVWFDDRHVPPRLTADARGKLMCWYAAPWAANWSQGRTYDLDWTFDSSDYSRKSMHWKGALWASVMFELYRKLGGDSADRAFREVARDLMLRLHTHALLGIATVSAWRADVAQELLNADEKLDDWNGAGLANGLHEKVIYDALRKRRLDPVLFGEPAVDVYIDDGRDGLYGSLTDPTDPFRDPLFVDPDELAPDVWVSDVIYPAAEQPDKTRADHVDPAAGSKAHLYARVKNRGSDPRDARVTVTAYETTVATPAWPNDWTQLGAAIAADVPAGGPGVVVGPFGWTATAAGRTNRLLVVVDCPDDGVDPTLDRSDRAFALTIAAGEAIDDVRLALFDNNVARRDVTPV